MIDRAALLKDLQDEQRALVADLGLRLGQEPPLAEELQAVYAKAKSEGRTGHGYVEWEEERLHQVAASWILACVFVRFLEDNGLVEVPRIGGPGERGEQALDEQRLYFQRQPSHSQRELLEDIFREAAKLPSLDALLGAQNPLWTLGPTADGAKALLDRFRGRDPETGELKHDFTDPAWDTRFLGDLYQDLSELARKRYALLQTPGFVESFLLDRTLEPAIGEFGLAETSLIDPACGSGHFLLGAFGRLFAHWTRSEPGRAANLPALAQTVLDQLAGVDVNPFAAAIARFRLLLAALRACGIERLRAAPGFAIHVAAGDSLLHGVRPGRVAGRQQYLLAEEDPIGHVYAGVEDPQALRAILGRRYAVVVANPPYITPKDSALNAAYRERFGSCHRQYALAVPFKERCFDLAATSDAGRAAAAGFVGMITANSFMKREFGKKLIEAFFPRWDLTHVIDTSGAYIPGHGTPTVVLLGRHRKPMCKTVRAVRGIRGEPKTPEEPAQGEVWSAILDQIDRPGSVGDFVSVDDVDVATFHSHPWSLGGGGAAELKERLEAAAGERLANRVDSIGFMCITKQDDVFSQPREVLLRHRCEANFTRCFGIGEEVRDWAHSPGDWVVLPYDGNIERVDPNDLEQSLRFMWPFRTNLLDRKVFGGSTYRDVGKPWYEYGQIPTDRFRTPLSIAFAFVATHNHFVLDRGGKVFNRTAPVIKLPAGASEDEHLALLGLLNSSTACFWMRQVTHDKGAGTDRGKWQSDPAKIAREFTGAVLEAFPIPQGSAASEERLRCIARELASLAQQRQRAMCFVERYSLGESPSEIRGRAPSDDERLLERMVFLQEELDWLCYELFGLTKSGSQLLATPDLLKRGAVVLGQRPFEICMAEAGEQRGLDGQLLATDFPQHWSAEQKQLWDCRLTELRASTSLRLIEHSTCKRRWLNTPKELGGRVQTLEDRLVPQIRRWLLDRLETDRYWPKDPAPKALQSAAQLADRVRTDADFLQVAALYRKREDFDVTALVAELVADEHVPAQAANRYKPPGLKKRAAWEETWRLQRLEDAGDDVGEVPVPPKYASGDFQKPSYWRLRGKLDVPKERFFSIPGSERDTDPTLVVGWAGWDHLGRADAIAAYYVERKEQDGWPQERLLPLLVALEELLPWLAQWHTELDPMSGERLDRYYTDFVDGQARELGVTRAELRAWRPPAKKRGGGRKKAVGKKKATRKKT